MSDAFTEAVERYRESQGKGGKKTRRSPKKGKSEYRHSSYWDGDILTISKSESKSSPHYLMKLSAHQRAMSNFVRILTGKNIPVCYPLQGESYTDGKKVVIGATIDEQGFDSTVGLAMHEASHIVYTEFGLLQEIQSSPDRFIDPATMALLKEKNFPTDYIQKILKDLLNYVEDRWIDAKSYEAAPGYRPYYTALYKKYWDSKEITKAMKSDMGREPKISSYMFRIINLTNPASDLSVLPGLGKIWTTLDLRNILRIKNTRESLKIASEILTIIAENVIALEVVEGESKVPSNHFNPGYPDKVEKSSSASGSGEGESGESEEKDENSEGGAGSEESEETSEESGSEGDEDSEDETEGEGSGSEGDEDSEEESEGDSDEESETDRPELTEKEQKKLEKAVESQKDFLRGEINKKDISAKNKKSLDTMAESGTEVVEVGDKSATNGNHDTSGGGYGRYSIGTYKAFLVKKLTEDLAASGLCPMFQVGGGNGMLGGKRVSEDSYARAGVTAGIAMGKALLKKIKVRSEDRVTKYSRLNKGKIDPRLIAELGFSNDGVFYQTLTDTYTDAALHISIDASGSMGGDKWKHSMTVAVAMAYVASNTEGLEVVIDFRATTNVYNPYTYTRTNDDPQPYVLIGFDSRVDHFSKVKKFFPYMAPHSATPEGLCFEAIMDYVQQSTTEQDSFFLNLSDGAPYFGQYCNEAAWDHTRKMVKMFQRRGIEVLSYFIGKTSGDTYGNDTAFRKMYGRTAKFIDVESVAQIARTMNEMFLSKGKKQV